MFTTEMILFCSIMCLVFLFIGICVGAVLSVSKDESIARNCTKCREEMQGMAKRLFFAGKGDEIDN